VGAILAIISAVFYGAWKFGIGFNGGKVTANVVIFISTASASTVYILWGVFSGNLTFNNTDVISGLVGGACNYVGSVFLLRAYERSKMGIVTGIGSASCLVPLVYSIMVGEFLSRREIIGLFLFAIGIFLCCSQNNDRLEQRSDARRAISQSLIAAFFYGIGIIILDVGTHESLTGTLLIALLPQVLFALLLLAANKKYWSGLTSPSFCILLLSGIALALANIAFYTASTEGNIGLYSVIRALNPLAIVVMAHIFLRERMSGKEIGALYTVLTGAALVVI
jgi:uncharacterized membrane protein